MLPPLSLLHSLALPTIGLLTRERVLTILSEDQLATCLTKGILERAQPRVFRVAGSPRTFRQATLAAVLSANGVASHRCAAVLWSLIDEPRVIEVTVPYPRQARLWDVVVHRSRDLVPSHVSRVNGIPATNPMRTVIDSSGVLRQRQTAEDLLEAGLSRGLYTVAAIEHVLAEVARPGRNGSGILGRILDERALGRDRPDGLLEPRMARLMRAANLPLAVFQLEVRIGRRRFRIDFAYPELMIAIEVDGYEKWTSPGAVQAAMERQNLLVRAGWTVLRFTWADVVRRPAYVARIIRDELVAKGVLAAL